MVCQYWYGYKGTRASGTGTCFWHRNAALHLAASLPSGVFLSQLVSKIIAFEDRGPPEADKEPTVPTTEASEARICSAV